MKQPSTEELVLFLKTSEPHKNVLRALPITVPLANSAYMFSNTSILFPQYVFIDLERWGLIKLEITYGMQHSGTHSCTSIAVPSWQITLTGEQYLAELDYERT
jgi:hypothetical protein